MSDAFIEKSRVIGIYRTIAPFYDVWARLTESKACARCLELAAIRDGEDVLEVAVGTGLTFEKILQANPSGRVEGIDLSEAMLVRARKRAAASGANNYRLGAGDACKLEFPDGSFDVLVNNYMIELLRPQDIPTVLNEFSRVLRPGGRLAITYMTKGRRWYNGLWERISRINPALLGGCRAVSLVPQLHAHGFRQIRHEYLSQWTFPSEIVCCQTPAT